MFWIIPYTKDEDLAERTIHDRRTEIELRAYQLNIVPSSRRFTGRLAGR